MKRQLLLFPLLLLTTSCSEAGLMSSRDSAQPLEPKTRPTSNAFVIVEADFQVFEFQIQSHRETTVEQINEILEVRDQLLEVTSQLEGYQSHEVGKPQFYTFYSKSGDILSSKNNAVRVALQFAFPEDPLKLTATLLDLIDEIPRDNGSTFELLLRNSFTGIDDPEKHRPEILAKALSDLEIIQKIDSTRFALSLTGIESPLEVAPYGSGRFIVSLPYSISIESIRDSAAENPALDEDGQGN